MGSSGRWAIGLCTALLCACAHRPLPAQHRALEPGVWEVTSLRTRLGDRLVELSAAGTPVELGAASHVYSARGTLLLAADQSCRLLLDLRVDGGSPGHSERPCTWRSEGDLVSLVDPDGAATLYRVEREPLAVVLEAIAELGPDGQASGGPSGERLVLRRQESSAPLAQLPEEWSDEGGI